MISQTALSRAVAALSLLSLLTFNLRVQAALTEQQKEVPLEVVSNDTSLAKIVLIAGSVSNKPGQHEYFSGGTMLMNCLKQTPGVFPVMVADGWPKNEAIFNNAKCIVFYMDGLDKLPFLDAARWAIVKKLAAQGTGLVILHQAVDCPEEKADEYKSWFGGVFQKDIGCRGHWDMKMEPQGTHAVLAGVSAFDTPKDGYLYNLHYADKATPVIGGMVPTSSRSSADAKTHANRAETIGWTYERPDGGRSFGFTGADLHKNWEIESQRRLVVNGILWSAKLEVPKTGAPVKIDADDLGKYMDRKSLPLAKPKVQ